MAISQLKNISWSKNRKERKKHWLLEQQSEWIHVHFCPGNWTSWNCITNEALRQFCNSKYWFFFCSLWTVTQVFFSWDLLYVTGDSNDERVDLITINLYQILSLPPDLKRMCMAQSRQNIFWPDFSDQCKKVAAESLVLPNLNHLALMLWWANLKLNHEFEMVTQGSNAFACYSCDRVEIRILRTNISYPCH